MAHAEEAIAAIQDRSLGGFPYGCPEHFVEAILSLLYAQALPG